PASLQGERLERRATSVLLGLELLSPGEETLVVWEEAEQRAGHNVRRRGLFAIGGVLQSGNHASGVPADGGDLRGGSPVFIAGPGSGERRGELGLLVAMFLSLRRNIGLQQMQAIRGIGLLQLFQLN